MSSYYPTRHAVEAMASRQVPWEQVLWVLTAPENRYLDRKKGTWVNQRGKLYVVTADQPRYARDDLTHAHPMYAVVTVGLRSGLTWTDADVRARDSSQGDE